MTTLLAESVVMGFGIAIFQGVVNLFVRGLDPIAVGMIAGTFYGLGWYRAVEPV